MIEETIVYTLRRNNMSYAVFYQETGEDMLVELSDSYTLEQAKEDYPECRFRYLQKYKTFSGYPNYFDDEYEGE